MISVDNPSLHGVMNMENMLNALWEKSVRNMTAQDLEWFYNTASTLTEEVTRSTISVSDGIGCLVLEDASKPNPGAGNFQSADDVPELLFFISHQLRTLASLAKIATDAHDLLRRVNGRRE